MLARRQPTALVLCVAHHPVFEALLTVCRDVAASGRGLRSADDYRRWWFVLVARDDDERLRVLPPDEPGLKEEDFIPGFCEGVLELVKHLDGIEAIIPASGDKRRYFFVSHARLTQEPLEDFLRDHGFAVRRIGDLLALDGNRLTPRDTNDEFDYRTAIGEALAEREPSVSADDRVALEYVLGLRDELASTLVPSATLFDTLPALPHPSLWCPHDHRQFDLVCRAGVFERIESHSYDAPMGESIYAWARELERRGAPPLEAIRSALRRTRSLGEDLELVAASARLRSAWAGDRSELDRQLVMAKRALVESIKGLVFDDVEPAPPAAETRERSRTPSVPLQAFVHSFNEGTYSLHAAWGQGDLLIAIGSPRFALRSTDAGATWSADSLPMERPVAIAGARLHDGRELIVAVGSDGAVFSWDRGESWQSSQTEGSFCAVAVAPDGRVCAVGPRQWALSRDVAMLPTTTDEPSFKDVAFDGRRFLAVADDDAVYGLDLDAHHTVATNLGAAMQAIAADRDLMIVLAKQCVATSENGGQSWSWTADERLGRPRAAAIERAGRRWLAAGAVLASDDGRRWQVVPVGDAHDARDIAITERAVVITSDDSLALVSRTSSEVLRFGGPKFADSPTSYAVAEHGLRIAALPSADETNTAFVDGDRLLLATGSGLLLSETGGRSFTRVDAPLHRREVMSIVAHAGALWAACDGLLVSSDGGHSWIDTGAPQISALHVAGGELFGVRGEWLLRHDPTQPSPWQDCRRFPDTIRKLVSDPSGRLHVLVGEVELWSSDDGGLSWRTHEFDEPIVGVVASAHDLLACDGQRLHVSHDHGRSFASHRLPLHVDSYARGEVVGIHAGADGELYISTDHTFLLHTRDRGRTLARVPAPFMSSYLLIRDIVEIGGRQHIVLNSDHLLERVDAREVPEPRFVELSLEPPASR